jgi:hypothetical protein
LKTDATETLMDWEGLLVVLLLSLVTLNFVLDVIAWAMGIGPCVDALL